MKIPEGITEQEVLRVIKKVIDKTAHSYTFYGYSVNDIRQESFIICMDALDRYNNEHRLENFLSSNLSNRLKNFIRDNHFTPVQIEKGKIVQPAQLDNEHSIVDYFSLSNNVDNAMDYREMAQVISQKLPASMRMDYLKIVNDIYLSNKRREEILAEVKEILIENNMCFGEGEEYEKG